METNNANTRETTMQAIDTYRVDHHGTSGTWYPIESGIVTMFDALTLAETLKADGYGARVVRERDGSIAMSAPWQESID
jgi:hypothetical protein